MIRCAISPGNQKSLRRICAPTNARRMTSKISITKKAIEYTPKTISRHNNGLVRCHLSHHPVHPQSSASTRQRWRVSSSSSSPPPPPTPSLNTTATSYEAPKSFIVGAIAGTLGSLAGMGGGFVMIPLMTSRHLLGLSQHVAHGTSLFAVTTTGIAGALGYGLTSMNTDETVAEQNDVSSSPTQETAPVVELDTALALALSGMITARIGASATSKISASALKRMLGVFMLGVAPLVPAKAYVMAAKHDMHREPQHQHHLEMKRYERLLPASIIGLGSGFLAGLFGVGGGAVVVPALALSTDMTHYQALGTSLAAMTLPAIVGTVTHYGKGNVCMRVAPVLAMGSFVGAFIGGRFVGLNMDEHTLRLGFSGLMVVLGTKTLLKI